MWEYLPVTVEHQADEEDDEEMVRVPENLEVWPADDFHGGSDDEDESQRDDHARQPGDGGEHDDGGALNQRTHIHIIYIKSSSLALLWQHNYNMSGCLFFYNT